jgi:hypothetical protein
MKYKSLTDADAILERIKKEGIFTFEDTLKICECQMYTVADKFETSLNSSDQYKLANLEKVNLWTIGTIFNAILLSDDPYNLLKMTERVKYELDKAYNYSKVIDKVDIEIYRKKISMKYAYLYSLSKKKATFIGKVPKSGFFSVRQVIADEWIQDFIKVLEIVLEYAFDWAKDVSVYSMFPKLYIASYLIKHYPSDFDIEPNENNFEYLLSVIVKFFDNGGVKSEVYNYYNSRV